jgi:uncharacterized membrane protein YhaH (DUF805 family)
MSEPSLARRILGPLGRLLDFQGRSPPADFWPYVLLLAGIYVVSLVLTSRSCSTASAFQLPTCTG